jgi:hypothetical protein
MKKKSFILFSILFLFCISIVANGITGVNATNDVLDVLEISSQGTRVESNIALQNGVNYEIVVSGVYYTGGTPIINNAHDAMYATQDNWATHSNGQSGLYIDRWNVGSKQWGAYNSEHIYRYTIVGNGTKVSFRIHDTSSYSDNSGSLTVQILGSPTTPQSSTPSDTSDGASSGTSSKPTENTPDSTDTSPTPSNNTPSISTPTSTNPTTETDSPFGNTFVITTAVIVTVIVVAVILLLTRSKKQEP